MQNLGQLLLLGRGGAELNSQHILALEGPVALRLDSLQEADRVDRVSEGRQEVRVPNASFVKRLLIGAPHLGVLVADHLP